MKPVDKRGSASTASVQRPETALIVHGVYLAAEQSPAAGVMVPKRHLLNEAVAQSPAAGVTAQASSMT